MFFIGITVIELISTACTHVGLSDVSYTHVHILHSLFDTCYDK